MRVKGSLARISESPGRFARWDQFRHDHRGTKALGPLDSYRRNRYYRNEMKALCPLATRCHNDDRNEMKALGPLDSNRRNRYYRVAIEPHSNIVCSTFPKTR